MNVLGIPSTCNSPLHFAAWVEQDRIGDSLPLNEGLGLGGFFVGDAETMHERTQSSPQMDDSL
jgi:hypothetical protein